MRIVQLYIELLICPCNVTHGMGYNVSDNSIILGDNQTYGKNVFNFLFCVFLNRLCVAMFLSSTDCLSIELPLEIVYSSKNLCYLI